MRVGGMVSVLGLLAGIAAGPAFAAETPLKIGVLTELSGPQATSGEHVRDGFTFFLKQHDGKLGGRTIEIVSEDTAGDPATTIAKAKKLVESDEVSLLIGPTNSGTAAAIKNYVTQQQIPMLEPATVDEVVGGKYIFRTSFASNADAFLEGYLPGKAGYRKAVASASNYLAGQGAVEYFEKGFVAAGGKVIQKLMPRLGTPDYGSFIAQISPDADVGIVFFPGSDGVRFIKQFGDYGSKLPLYGYTVTVDETLLPAEGQAALGFIGACFYFSTIDTPENRAFLKDWSAVPDHDKPTWLAVSGYIAAEVLDQAISKVGGKTEDKDALVAAIKAAQVTTPAGPFRFDEHNNPVQPRYIAQIRDVNGTIEPVILGVIPEFLPVPAAPSLPADFVWPK
jgi:branched-chain amino acid transport system substrate-binding protein